MVDVGWEYGVFCVSWWSEFLGFVFSLRSVKIKYFFGDYGVFMW